MITVSTACLFEQSLCTRWIASARARAKTVFGHLKSYLKNRLQRCNVNNHLSSATPLNCGVPQGSIISPLLFLIYIKLCENYDVKRETVHCYPRNVDRCCWNLSAILKICFRFVLLYNKSLNDWSLGEQWILFPSNLNVSLDFVSGNIEIPGKQNTLFPSGPVIKCLM